MIPASRTPANGFGWRGPLARSLLLPNGALASSLGYHCTDHVSSPNATHFIITKRT